MSNNPSERAPEEPRAAEAAQWLWPAAAVVGALFVTALSLLLFTGGGDEDLGAGSGAPAGASSTTSTTRATGAPGVTVETRTTGTGTPSGSPPATTTRSGAGSTTTVPPASLVTVPVYYVMDVEGVGPRLYREFHRVPAQGDQVRSALAEMFAAARDPDYRSLWPPSTRVLGSRRPADQPRSTCPGSSPWERPSRAPPSSSSSTRSRRRHPPSRRSPCASTASPRRQGTSTGLARSPGRGASRPSATCGSSHPTRAPPSGRP